MLFHGQGKLQRGVMSWKPCPVFRGPGRLIRPTSYASGAEHIEAVCLGMGWHYSRQVASISSAAATRPALTKMLASFAQAHPGQQVHLYGHPAEQRPPGGCSRGRQKHRYVLDHRRQEAHNARPGGSTTPANATSDSRGGSTSSHRDRRQLSSNGRNSSTGKVVPVLDLNRTGDLPPKPVMVDAHRLPVSFSRPLSKRPGGRSHSATKGRGNRPSRTPKGKPARVEARRPRAEP